MKFVHFFHKHITWKSFMQCFKASRLDLYCNSARVASWCTQSLSDAEFWKRVFNLSTCMSLQNQSDTLDMLLDRRRSHPHVAHWPPSQSSMKRLFKRERESGTPVDHHALRTVTTFHNTQVPFPVAVLCLTGWHHRHHSSDPKRWCNMPKVRKSEAGFQTQVSDLKATRLGGTHH